MYRNTSKSLTDMQDVLPNTIFIDLNNFLKIEVYREFLNEYRGLNARYYLLNKT